MDASWEGRVVTEQRNGLLTRGLLGRRPLSECYKYSLEGAYKVSFQVKQLHWAEFKP